MRQVRVEHVIRDLSRHAQAYADFDVQTLFVREPTGELLGAIELRDLVLADHSRALAELVKTDVPAVPAATPLDQLEDLFDAHEMAVVPIVDDRNRQVGIIRYSDMIEALAERAEEDFMKTQGIVTGDEIRTMPLAIRSRRRLSWLSINIVLNVIAASVIALYQDTLSAVIALAVFLPIVSDMSGCSGNQAVAVSLRELTLGIVKPFEVVHVWLKEAAIGVINGLALGCLLGFVAWLWKGNLYLSIVVGIALMANTLVAVSIGGTVPLVLKRFGVDPAVASGPILTTITDMIGFFLLLSFASLMLPFLSDV